MGKSSLINSLTNAPVAPIHSSAFPPRHETTAYHCFLTENKITLADNDDDYNGKTAVQVGGTAASCYTPAASSIERGDIASGASTGGAYAHIAPGGTADTAKTTTRTTTATTTLRLVLVDTPGYETGSPAAEDIHRFLEHKTTDSVTFLMLVLRRGHQDAAAKQCVDWVQKLATEHKLPVLIVITNTALDCPRDEWWNAHSSTILPTKAWRPLDCLSVSCLKLAPEHTCPELFPFFNQCYLKSQRILMEAVTKFAIAPSVL